jgi:hypothetical protein
VPGSWEFYEFLAYGKVPARLKEPEQTRAGLSRTGLFRIPVYPLVIVHILPPKDQTHLAFSTARQTVVEMGRVFQVGALPIDEDLLPPLQHCERLHREFAQAGLQFADDADSEQKLAEFRNTSEPFLKGLAHYLVLSVPDWLPTGPPWITGRTIHGERAQRS